MPLHCVPDFPTDIVIVAFYHILQTQQKLKQQGQANLICLERFPTLQFVPKLLWEKEVLYASTYGKWIAVDPLVALLFKPTSLFAFVFVFCLTDT